MNYTVSFSDFRKNISKFSDMVSMGKTVTVKDEKRGVSLFKIVKADEDNFNWNEYTEWMDNFKPFITDAGVKSMKKFRDSFNKRFEEARNR